MSNKNIELIKSIYDRFNNRNYEAVLRNISEDFKWIAADNSPLADQSPYHGIDAVRDGVFARIEAGFSKLTVQIDEIFGAGDKVVVLGYYEGVFAGSGKLLHAQLAHIWTVSDDKAAKFQQYVDTYKIAESSKAAVKGTTAAEAV